MIFLAKLKKHHFSPGPESSLCQLFPLDDIPFNSLSFQQINSFFFSGLLNYLLIKKYFAEYAGPRSHFMFRK